MKVLVIGSGGREHALVWKIVQSQGTEKCYCIPGNAGIAEIADCSDIDLNDFSGIADFVKREKIGLTLVGPEAPLVAGISEYFNKEGLAIFAPSAAAARLEGSKVFAKRFMEKYKVPTAGFEAFSDSAQAIKYIKGKGAPVVVKADGLAAGKGVIVASSTDEAVEAVHQILDERVFGEAGNEIIVEDCLSGEEVSMLALVDENSIVPLMSSQDHKRVYDADKGPNTGGMGAYSPAGLVTSELKETIHREVFDRMREGFKAEGMKYNGILYAGLMIRDGSVQVLEFNVRFGDPETQAILPLMQTDFLKVVNACVHNKLDTVTIEWKDECCVCVVLASGGYPGKYEKGRQIKGLSERREDKDVTVFHAGTKISDGGVVTCGGRVLGVTALAPGIEGARKKAYAAIENISFEGMQYRKDIGLKALKRIN